MLEDFSFESNVFKGVITVSKGFVTDFASVPRFGILYAWLGNIAQEPAVIHDWLYQKHLVGKAKADLVFLEGMRYLNTIKGMNSIPWLKRELMYLGVKYGGSSSYEDGVDRFKVLNSD